MQTTLHTLQLLSAFPFLETNPNNIQNIQIVVIVLQFIIALSILNVWVFQYETIVVQFKEFNLPVWLRNAVGWTKAVFCIVLLAGIWVWQLAVVGALAIGMLMVFAILTHLRAKDPFYKIFPAIVLFALCLAVAFLCYQYKFKG